MKKVIIGSILSVLLIGCGEEKKEEIVVIDKYGDNYILYDAATKQLTFKPENLKQKFDITNFDTFFKHMYSDCISSKPNLNPKEFLTELREKGLESDVTSTGACKNGITYIVTNFHVFK